LSSFGLLIDKFRSIKENDTFTDSIVSKRIKIKIEEKYGGLTDKIMRETELSLPKRIQELRDLKISGYSKIEKKIKNNAGLNELENRAKELRENQFKYFSDEELDFLDIPAKELKIKLNDETRLFFSAVNKQNDLTKEIYNEWVNLDPDRFEKWEIIKPDDTKDSPYYDWYQFCRYCLIDYERVEYMQERIWRIYDMYEEYYRFDKPVYFKFDSLSQDSTSKGFNFPIDFARIRFLEEKAKELLVIHKQILGNVSFIQKKQSTDSIKPRGNIDWKKTIQLQINGHNSILVSRQTQKNFVTPENILFIISAFWIINKAEEYLRNEKLFTQEIEMLSAVRQKMKKIINDFPFPQVPLSVKKDKLDKEYDKKILKLVTQASQRMTTGKIQNPGYKKLLKWIGEVRNNTGLKTLQGIVQDDSLILLSLRDIDTMYELWVMFELIHQIFIKKEPKFDIDLATGEIKQINFNWNGKNVEMFYDKMFTRGKRIKKSTHDTIVHDTNSEICGPYTKLVPVKADVRPDFSFRTDGKFIAVFDTKQYYEKSPLASSKDGSRADAFTKIMGYAYNFESCHLGLAIMPHERWTAEPYETSPYEENIFRPILMMPLREFTEDKEKNPKSIQNIISMLDRVISQ
tara:strand:+ start:2494 stop:4383 length:1890 start_codon:yes stop_codon:yes gene_type:complete